MAFPAVGPAGFPHVSANSWHVFLSEHSLSLIGGAFFALELLRFSNRSADAFADARLAQPSLFCRSQKHRA